MNESDGGHSPRAKTREPITSEPDPDPWRLSFGGHKLTDGRLRAL